MIVYKNTSAGFVHDVETNKITKRIKESVLNAFGWNKVRENEEMAWGNSMQYMGNVIRRSGIAEDCGILIEYNLPATSLRVDFIVSGNDETGRPSFIIVELKQWKEAKSTSKDGVVFTDYYGFTTHPSYQAYSYKLFLKDFNEGVYTSSILGYSCSYLHNYVEKNPEPLKADIYKSILRESPIYFQDDQLQLEEFLRIYVGKGKGEEILYEIENGNIRPSKKLIDHVGSLFSGNSEFVLIDEQKVAFEAAKQTAQNAKEKTVIIVTGGPGTGKSVISMNLLGALLPTKNAFFVAPNASFRDVMTYKLTKEYDAKRIKHLLKGSGAFYGARKNSFDVLIVDEAHRLKNNTAFMYKGKNQIEDIINAARVSIFFIDEKQIIRPEDIGSLDEITRIAETQKATIHKFNLTAQFRCSGADGYVNWLEDVLQLSPTGNFDGWDKKDFEFEILDNPKDLKNRIRQKAKEGKSARLLAGYAWDWTPANKGNANAQTSDVLIPEFQFGMPWNSRSIGTTWAVDHEGIEQVGCVHTSQGLEFDYVGVIIGRDLQFNSTKRIYFTNWNEYKDSKGKQGLKTKPAELNKLVRNIYRILLTRGIKGCYVYFLDKEAEHYFKSRMRKNTRK